MWKIISIVVFLFAAVRAFDYVDFKKKYCYEDTNVRTTSYYFPYTLGYAETWATSFVCEHFILTKDDLDFMATNKFTISSHQNVVLKNCEINYFNEYFVSKFSDIRYLYFENCKLSLKNPDVIGNTAVPNNLQSLGFHKCNILENLKSSALQKFDKMRYLLIQNSTFQYDHIDEYFLQKQNCMFYITIDNVNVKSFYKGFLSNVQCDLQKLACTTCQLEEIDSLFYQMKQKVSHLVSFDNNSIKKLSTSLDILANFNELLGFQLSGNDIQEEVLKRIYLKSLKKLEVLDLSRNSDISSIDFLSFKDTVNLQRLNMSKVNLKSLNKLGNTNFTTIDFSQNIISSIQREVFEGLVNLSFLDLSHNLIEEFQGEVFKDLKLLKELRLNSNKISVLHNNLFSGLTSLITLNLSDNHLTRIDGLDNLIKLEELHLQNNFLKIIPSSRSLPNSLRILDISNNSLSFIGRNTFSNVHQLTSLDISYTNNTYINFDNECLQQLTSLRTLKSAGNAINSIEDIFLPVSLRNLDLQHNKIPTITNKGLSGLVNLEFLNLANNHIYAVENDVMLKLSEIKYVDLSGNDL